MIMIKRFALMFFSTVAMWCGAANTDGCDIYLLMGQSNMSGRGALSAENALPNDRIIKFSKKKKWVPAREPLHFDRKSCGAGLAMSFARKMADASPARTIALVPCAVGGTPLQRWCPEGDLYSNAVVRARAALKKGTLKGILWHQGCADANNITNARTYAARLVPMVARLRKDIGAEDVPFVAGELPRFLSRYVEKNGHHHHWPIVNAQLAEAVSKIPHAALVSSEGLDDCRDDLIHFETPSLRKLGERYAEAMLRLQAEGKTVPENDHVKELPPFVVGVDALDPAGGHVQGIAASEDALYISQMTRIVKLDWKGNVLATRNVQSHTGDIAWHDGELYTAVAVYPERKEGRIQVFDKDLNLLRETTIDRTIDGIAYADGVLLVGMGAKEQPSSKPHRVNILGCFDAKTLKEIAPRAEFEYGHDTVFGFQNIAFDSGCFIASFYSVKGSPEVVFFDRNLKVLGTAYAQCNQGFDILPKSMRADGRRFVRAKTTVSKSPPAVSCEFDFIELKRLAASQARIKPPEPNVMRTEANSPVVKEVRLEAQFVVSPETRIGGLTTGRIKVGSYNIRMSAADNGTSNAWDERKEDLADLIRKLDLDVFGMQEVCPDQEAFLRARLPDYLHLSRFA